MVKIMPEQEFRKKFVKKPDNCHVTGKISSIFKYKDGTKNIEIVRYNSINRPKINIKQKGYSKIFNGNRIIEIFDLGRQEIANYFYYDNQSKSIWAIIIKNNYEQEIIYNRYFSHYQEKKWNQVQEITKFIYNDENDDEDSKEEFLHCETGPGRIVLYENLEKKEEYWLNDVEYSYEEYCRILLMKNLGNKIIMNIGI